eukprot:CAMPEP_0117765108 /NCGR_PEP_ID=MMETSP0947-20121206/19877_1 /TAXON_ID=44440 /ORGANISM="Chattonella subsalsa, Strain CCMP2191" /LENGTH=37 /DNA_ID= /DNA_START= /DNA_END= /DNA_ORIENTATION=
MSEIAPECRELWDAIQAGRLGEFQSEMRKLEDVNRPM